MARRATNGAEMTASSGQRRVAIVRSALAHSTSPTKTSALLFEALGSYGDQVPETVEELMALVHGPLWKALVQHLGEEEATDIVARIEGELRDDRTILMDEADLVTVAEPVGRDATTAVPTSTAAVPVTVVSSGSGFAERLVAALGPRRVSARAVGAIESLSALQETPAIVIVDATDFAPIEPADLSQALSTLPSTTAHVIWACDLPYGRRTVDAMHADNLANVALPRDEGVEPLLDLIRSRRRADPVI